MLETLRKGMLFNGLRYVLPVTLLSRHNFFRGTAINNREAAVAIRNSQYWELSVALEPKTKAGVNDAFVHEFINGRRNKFDFTLPQPIGVNEYPVDTVIFKEEISKNQIKVAFPPGHNIGFTIRRGTFFTFSGADKVYMVTSDVVINAIEDTNIINLWPRFIHDPEEDVETIRINSPIMKARYLELLGADVRNPAFTNKTIRIREAI